MQNITFMLMVIRILEYAYLRVIMVYFAVRMPILIGNHSSPVKPTIIFVIQ